jgi:RNA polymerase sigma-70 factor (ECF subfamily)
VDDEGEPWTTPRGGRGTSVADRTEAVAVLVEQVRDGDMSAFSALYRSHVGVVMQVIRDNVRDPETVADVTQEVFARVLERLGTLRATDRFRPWLMAIARHAAIDQRRRRSHTPDALDDRHTEPPDAGPGPDEVAELNDLARVVQGAVAGLSRRDATALTLVTQLGLQPGEVALALGVTPGAAKVILCRARRRLREVLTLDLVVRRNAHGCPTLARALDREDLLGAARHVRRCPVCSAVAEVEVELYAVGC